MRLVCALRESGATVFLELDETVSKDSLQMRLADHFSVSSNPLSDRLVYLTTMQMNKLVYTDQYIHIYIYVK